MSSRPFILVLSGISLLLILVHVIFYDKETYFLVVGNLTILVLYAITLLRKRPFLDPIFYITITVFFSVLMRSYYMVYYPEKLKVGSLLLRGHVIEFFNLSSTVILLGLFLFTIAYHFWKPKKLKINWSDMDQWSSRRLYFWVIVITLLATISFIQLTKSSGITNFYELFQDFSGKRSMKIDGADIRGSMGYLRLLVSFGQIATYIFLIHLFSRSERTRIYDILLIIYLIILGIIFPVFVSSRSLLVIFGLNIFLILYYFKKLTTLNMSISLGIISFLLVIMIQFRGAKVDESGFSITSLVESIVINRNFVGVSKTAHIMDKIPSEFPFMYGSSYLTMFVGPIPRTLWKDKPALGLGLSIKREIYKEQANWGGIPPGIVAEFYINFGILGVVLGMFFLGIFLKVLFYQLVPSDQEWGKAQMLLFLGLLTSTCFYLISSGINEGIVNFLKYAIPTLFIVFLIQSDDIKSTSHLQK